MRLRISDPPPPCGLWRAGCGFRIACRVIVPLMLLAAMPMIAVAQSQSADAPPDAAVPPATQPVRPLVPITFVRSGCNAVIKNPMTFNRLVKQVALSAFGRTWTETALSFDKGMDHYQFETTVPAVRVPTVFSVTPTDAPPFELCQIVAYPDRDVAWDKKIVLMAAGPPEWEWFRQWASATGLPVTWLEENAKLADNLPKLQGDQRALLILGRSAAGGELAHAVKLANEKAVNILVLDTDWLSDAAGTVEVGGGQMRGDLLAITGKQTWARGLEFRSHRQPCGTIANRWAWIADRDGLPLVEAVAVAGTPLTATHPVVLNYLPWAEQLGRREEADDLLRATLVAAAETTLSDVAWRSPNFLHPKREQIDRKDRPVLAAVASMLVAFKDLPWSVHVVDVRGTDRLPEGLREELKVLESRVGADAESLLILGDDKMLDEWEWLKLDRAKKLIGAAGVQWLPDDELPPSKENQIRLMLTLTELGAPLAPPDQEEERK